MLPMFAVSVSQSVCLHATRRVQCVRGAFVAAFAKFLLPLVNIFKVLKIRNFTFLVKTELFTQIVCCYVT